MQDINKTIVVGRVTRDIDDKAYIVTKSGTARLNISVAVNRSVKQGDQWVDNVSYFDVTIWGKTAENMRKFLSKGSRVCIDGHLQQDRWEKDGHKQSKVYIVADSLQLLDGKKDGVQQGSPAQQGFNPADGFEEDIPF